METFSTLLALCEGNPPVTGGFPSTGHRWIPITKASDAELWCFLWSGLEQTVKKDNQDAGDLRSQRANYGITRMRCGKYQNMRSVTDWINYQELACLDLYFINSQRSCFKYIYIYMYILLRTDSVGKEFSLRSPSGCCDRWSASDSKWLEIRVTWRIYVISQVIPTSLRPGNWNMYHFLNTCGAQFIFKKNIKLNFHSLSYIVSEVCNTMECRHNAVQYNTRVYAAPRRLGQNFISGWSHTGEL